MKIENISNHHPILTFENQEPGVSAIFVGVLGGFGFRLHLARISFSSPKISQDVYICWNKEVFLKMLHWPGIVTIAKWMEISKFERGVTFSEAHHVQYLQGVVRNWNVGKILLLTVSWLTWLVLLLLLLLLLLSVFIMVLLPRPPC